MTDQEIIELAKQFGAFDADDARGWILWSKSMPEGGLLAFARALLATSGVATPLSDFIRNASPERKAEVFGRVMDNVTERQKAVIAAAGGVAGTNPASSSKPAQSSNPGGVALPDGAQR